MLNRGNANINGGGGIGCVGVLTICFIVLKVLDLIDWSWLWVFSPVWIALSLVLLVAIFALLVIVGAALIAAFRK